MPCVQRQNPALEALCPITLAPAAQLLEPLVLGPAADRPDEGVLGDVDEAGLRNPVLHVLDGVEGAPRALAQVQDARAEAVVHAVRGVGARGVGIRLHAELEVLEPAAGLEVCVGLGVESGPVGDAAGESADVDVVEGGEGVGPFLRGIVDFEGDGRREGGCLRGGEVGGGYTGAGKEVRYVTMETLAHSTFPHERTRI